MSISCPEIENDEIFIVIKSHMRNNHRLNKSLLHKIYSRYFIYDYFARCHQLQHLPPIIEDQTEKNFLISLYNNHMANKKKIEAYQYYERLLHCTKNNLCPLCQLDTVCELDHFLPKSKYPEFSIYHKNLIPSCHICNNLKKNNVDIKFVHAYYDDINNFELLRARIKIIDKKVVWDFYVENRDYGYLNSYKEMFEFLKLADKYNMRATDILTGFIIDLQSIMPTIDVIARDILAEMLTKRIDSYIVEFGVNYWITVVYKTIFESLDDLIIEGCLTR